MECKNKQFFFCCFFQLSLAVCCDKKKQCFCIKTEKNADKAAKKTKFYFWQHSTAFFVFFLLIMITRHTMISRFLPAIACDFVWRNVNK